MIRMTEAQLRKLEATKGHQWVTEIRNLVAEVRRLRALVEAAYDHYCETQGMDGIEELEREVLAIRKERRRREES